MKLIEIIIALAIASIFSLVSFSSYHHYEQQKEFENAMRQFIGVVDFAKKMSIASDEPIYLCSGRNQTDCDDTWIGRLIVFQSSDPPAIQTILQTFPALPSAIQLTISSKTPPALSFKPDSEGANNATLTFNAAGEQSKIFTLSIYGTLTETDSH